METLPRQFEDALSLIEISGERVQAVQTAHQDVRGCLETSKILTDWGVDTILIGSYSRHTGIHPGKDVDVFTKLAKLPTSVSPESVFAQVRNVLREVYGRRARPQNRSVKIDFNGFHVDAVPAVRSGSRWAIPDRELRSWVDTDPEGLGELTTVRNRFPVVEGRGAYVPIVKLVRQIRAHHLGDSKPGGLYFEILTYRAFEAGVSAHSFAELLEATLAWIAQRISGVAADPLIEPATERVFEPQPEAHEIEQVLQVFKGQSARATAALHAARCAAAVAWRQILGSNDRGSCFPLPEGCDEQGRARGPVIANPNRGVDEARPFGA